MVKYICFILILILELKCTSVDSAVRETDRFSTSKTYAVLPFDCPNKEIGMNVSEELKNKLADFGFKIMEREEAKKIISAAGLTEESIIGNYTLAINNLKGIDAIIVGKITLERGLSSGELIGSGSSGSYSNYINSCEAQAVEIKTGERIGNAWYKAPALSNTSGSVTPAFVADKIARKLSPH